VATLERCTNMVNDYHYLVQHVRDDGDVVAPRGLKTYDVGPTLIEFDDPTQSLAVGVGRRLSTNIAAVEAAMLVGGFCDEALLARVAPQLLDYADETHGPPGQLPVRRLHGAYGRRIGGQLGTAIQKIKFDQSTRRAVITLWDPWLDNLAGMHDYPCTVALQLIVRDGKLDLHVTMRSSDVWRGLPYDVFQFSQLQLTAATLLALPVGTYYHMAWSLHLYETDLAAVDEMLSLTPSKLPVDTSHDDSHFYQPRGFGRPRDSLSDVQRRIQMLISGPPRGDLVDSRTLDIGTDLTRSEEWFGARLRVPRPELPGV
jgi:thymidylate synthase